MKYEMKLKACKFGGFDYEIYFGPTLLGGGHRKEEREAREVGLEDLQMARQFKVCGDETA